MLPTRLIASARSPELTANAASTLANLLITWVDVNPALEKLFIAAVNVSTLFAASSPDNLLKISASLVLFKVSSTPKP